MNGNLSHAKKWTALLSAGTLLLFSACRATPDAERSEPAVNAAEDAATQTAAITAVPDTAARVYTETTTAPSAFLSAPDAELAQFLSALSAGHSGYKTTYTAEEGAAYTQEHLLGACPAAFSDSGRAMALYAIDFGMGETVYRICFTTDAGETWQVCTEPLNLLGAVSGIVTDGTVFWAYGDSSAAQESFLLPLSDHMYALPEKRGLGADVRALLPDAETFYIYACAYDGNTERITVDVGLEPNPGGTKPAVLHLELDKDLRLTGSEKLTAE